jgi:SAM-dependent methyltransferase
MLPACDSGQPKNLNFQPCYIHFKRLIAGVPEVINAPFRNLWHDLKYRGKARYCPACKKFSGRFKSFGVPPREQRKDAACPRCGALERHRLLCLFLEQRTDLFNCVRNPTMLHVAPERALLPRFQEAIGEGYLTADLGRSDAMVKMDITDIKYPEDSFDVIYCSHVLEHVQDDRRAMREFYRVLKKTGWAILLVPIEAEETYEDPSVTDPEERALVFGQSDHVRAYGSDYVDRLRAAGFKVEKSEVADLADKQTAELMGLTEASGDIFLCTK